MSLTDGVLSVMWIGVTAYALLAGADFGAGFWDLIAGSPERGKPQRQLIARSIGPVWEANHVWLIFVLVVLWTGFPRAFAAIASTLYIPLTVAAIGVILRGSGFAFRKATFTLRLQRLFGATFALSSVLTPFFLGTVAGAVASGRVPEGNAEGDLITSWLNPTSVLGGTLAVISCAYLAAVYLSADATRVGATDLAQAFRKRALVSGVVAGAVALPGIAVLGEDAPELFDGLTGRALPLIGLTTIAGLVSLMLIWRKSYATARISAALAVAAVVWGWAVAQYPYLLENALTIDEAAAARPTMMALFVSLVVGGVILAPALVWLFALTNQGRLTDEPDSPVGRENKYG